METQLVRLDKPYNIICGSDGSFGLHIATLILVKEEPVKAAKKTDADNTVPMVRSYPVVGGGYGIDGEVWMKSELKDCEVICREGMSVGLYTLKKLMEFCSKIYWFERLLDIPGALSIALLTYGSKFELPTDDNKRIISDYEVRLEFSENNNGKSCMVYGARESDFFFYDYFDNETPVTQFTRTNSLAINYLAELRDSYVRAFHFEGLRSITFTTKDESYQWFVDKLNSVKEDAAGV